MPPCGTVTANNYVDLHPVGCGSSEALGVQGGQQVGNATYQTGPSTWRRHAILWNSSATDYVDLHPAGYEVSYARSVSNGQQVGYALPASRPVQHAILWNGSASDFVDLMPPGMAMSEAYAIDDGEIVGFANPFDPSTGRYDSRPILWTNGGQTVVDLMPATYMGVATGVCNGKQVGYGGPGTSLTDTPHAFVWSGTVDSMQDLHAFVPASFTASQALGIDSAGNIVGRAWYTTSEIINPFGDYGTVFHTVPVLWTPVPEPMTILLLGGLLAGTGVRRARHV